MATLDTKKVNKAWEEEETEGTVCGLCACGPALVTGCSLCALFVVGGRWFRRELPPLAPSFCYTNSSAALSILKHQKNPVALGANSCSTPSAFGRKSHPTPSVNGILLCTIMSTSRPPRFGFRNLWSTLLQKRSLRLCWTMPKREGRLKRARGQPWELQPLLV